MTRYSLTKCLAIGGLLGALATPAFADRNYVRAHESGLDRATIEQTVAGANATYEMPSCDGFDQVRTQAVADGFDAEGACENGLGWLALHGEPKAAERYLKGTIDQLMAGAGEPLLESDVEAQRAALSAVLGRFSITTPGSTNPNTTIASAGIGADGTTTLEQHTRDGLTFSSAYCKTDWYLTRLPTVGRSGTAYPQHAAMLVNPSASDMVDASSYCRMDLKVENGVEDLLVDNYTPKKQFTVKPASWARSALDVALSADPSARDDLIAKDVKESTTVKLCDDIDTSSGFNCHDAEIAFIRDVLPDTYREEIRTTTGAGGTAVVSAKPTYLVDGTLYRGPMATETSLPEWTFTKEVSIGLHAPKEQGTMWLLGDTGGGVTYSDMSPLPFEFMYWAEDVYDAPAHPSRLQP